MAEPAGIEAPVAALAAVIRAQDAPAALESDLGAFLRAHGVQGPDLAAMTAVGAKRMLVYRALVHNRMRNTTRDFIPRTVARIGMPRFRRDCAAFLDQRAPRSPYLRDVPIEFVEWIAPRWADDPEIPGYIPDLAQHELLDAAVRNDPRGGEPPTGLPLALDRPLRFDGAVRLRTYDYAVHRLPRDPEDRTEPVAEPTRLLAYRDRAQHRTRYLALIPFAAAVLQRLVEEGLAVQPALQAAAASLGEPLDDQKLASAAQLIADLGERGVCLGAEPG